MTAARGVFRASTLLRSLALVAVVGLVLLLVTDSLSPYRNLQLADGAYYFCVLAGLTVLAGSSGQISLGHGAFMAVGAYTVAKLGNAGWALLPELAAAVVVTLIVGIPVGMAASRLRGPYLAGATLAFAVGLPALADKFPAFFGGENGLSINPPVPPSSLGSSFPLERWEAWIACGGALVTLFVFYNVNHSGIGRSLRAVRDDEIAASLAGLRVGRMQTLAFALSAAAAGLGGGLLAVVTQLAQPGAFPLQLSLTLLAGVVIGGLGSLWGAVWGAALLVLLPNWTNDIANSFSLSTNVSHNLPIAVYGLVLIGAMLLWPSGIQGGVRAAAAAVRPRVAARAGHARPADVPDAGAGEPTVHVGSGGAASDEAAKTPSEH
ncbi:MAG: branched-chain amino acid ABC transporter permease [Solirubrobacterales bacterium]|nr:branched-chain amino acid ABC transporter permease [Solirubrobacterales bacterium]MBV9944464.1 branched-chain amino acid ABC transporter permease [Solirubrobacterales bacterium]